MKRLRISKVDRKIQKLADYVYATDYLINMVVDQHRDDFVATRDGFEIYASQNNGTIEMLTDLVRKMVEVDKKAQNEIMELKSRIAVLEK